MLEGLKAPAALAISWNSVVNAGTSLNPSCIAVGGPLAPCILFFGGGGVSSEFVESFVVVCLGGSSSS